MLPRGSSKGASDFALSTFFLLMPVHFRGWFFALAHPKVRDDSCDVPGLRFFCRLCFSRFEGPAVLAKASLGSKNRDGSVTSVPGTYWSETLSALHRKETVAMFWDLGSLHTFLIADPLPPSFMNVTGFWRSDCMLRRTACNHKLAPPGASGALGIGHHPKTQGEIAVASNPVTTVICGVGSLHGHGWYCGGSGGTCRRGGRERGTRRWPREWWILVRTAVMVTVVADCLLQSVLVLWNRFCAGAVRFASHPHMSVRVIDPRTECFSNRQSYLTATLTATTCNRSTGGLCRTSTPITNRGS